MVVAVIPFPVSSTVRVAAVIAAKGHGSKWDQITLTNFCAPMTHTYSRFIAVTALNG